MAVTAGDLAPAFDLPGVHDGRRRRYTLAEFAGSPLVIATYPGDNTPVCTRQLNTYTADIDQFRDLGAAVVGVSPDSIDSHEGFSDAQGGFAFPLLADEDRALAEAYGVLGPLGYYRRCVFVVGPDGRLAHVHRGFAGATFRRTPELLYAVEQARAAS